ncbi:hypothetical protein PoB_002534600 [Plakobranchus ocellatus]|uniref:Secreted protein n=1 Tax=Plakobranchus ocellatus TaxID=259542 RepID=A0AAV3ZI83_9GAST|nr:hypothetical protein PoB_002534600 [Plakobranchus ocellatus]
MWKSACRLVTLRHRCLPLPIPLWAGRKFSTNSTPLHSTPLHSSLLTRKAGTRVEDTWTSGCTKSIADGNRWCRQPQGEAATVLMTIPYVFLS